MATTTPPRSAPEDLLGFDRLARVALRSWARLSPSLVLIQGAPGSGKVEFLRRCQVAVELEPDLLGTEAATAFHPVTVWYNPWLYAPQGSPLVGFVGAVARCATSGPPSPIIIERARDIVSQINRLRFDGNTIEAPSSTVSAESDPVDKVRRGFFSLVEQVRGSSKKRLLVLVADLDRLPPLARLAFLDGLRILLDTGAEVTAAVALGNDAALATVRYREPGISDTAAQRILETMVDVQLTVPRMEMRRMNVLFRRLLGSGELVVRRAFGDDALNRLLTASAYRPLGTPRFMERLTHRVTLLAEFAFEMRLMRELTEAQWAWVILSERWPDFRRFMLRGGRERWAQLKMVLHNPTEGYEAEPELVERLRADAVLTEYLFMYAEGFEQDNENIYWMDGLLLQAGL